MLPKNNLRQNTVCLEQQAYASQENCIQPLVVMVETFRRSSVGGIVVNWLKSYDNVNLMVGKKMDFAESYSVM